MRIIGERIPEWTFEEISNGRFALKRNGIVIFVAYSQEEINERWKTIVSSEENKDTSKSLNNAIGRL